MQVSYLILFALGRAVKGASLMEALASQNTTLSTLNSLLATEPAIVQMLTAAKDITILAPSNDAFASFVQNPENKAAASDSATLMAVLEYHVLKGMHMASTFTSTMHFLPTMLGASSNMTMDPSMMSNMSLSSVTGGQVVGAMKIGDMVEIMSGLKETSMVQTADIMFEGGVIHIIDSVLTVPKMPSVSALDSQLTALAGALKKTNLLLAVDMMKDVTIFAPSNAAFQAIGSATGTLTEQQLAGILEYHIINGTVGYSTLLSMGLANETIPTLGGPELKVQVTNNKVFVNGAQVEIADVLISNGVMHIVNAVLNPTNTTATPNPAATTQAIMFAGAAAASNVPFTSGISATTTAPSATTQTAAARLAIEKPVVGVVGAAALFGMVVAGL